ncbi:Putative Zinc finger C2H2-type [Septoria linicola]|uniref:Zinc finger C2H2-type n=1 Tax=Septoria linicola TaxID=215465 RepID=A0A9Q9B610_9PEZI|nr:Putative Zinc finger C2H2-type [Septoria linicola]
MPKSPSRRPMADAQSDSDEFEPELAVPAHKSTATIPCDESDDEASDVDLPDNDPARPHKCKICRKGFTIASYRNVHQKAVHTGKKPWRCSERNKRFNRKVNAMRHQTLHSGHPKPWLCPVCKVTFNQKVHVPGASQQMGESCSAKTKKHSTKHIKPKKIPEPAPVAKPSPGRIKSTPTSGPKRKHAPAATPDPEEDSGIDLPSKPSRSRKSINKKRKGIPIILRPRLGLR